MKTKNIRFYPENNTYYDKDVSMFISKAVLMALLDNDVKLSVTTPSGEEVTNAVYGDYLKLNYDRYKPESIYKTLRRRKCES